MKYEAGQIMEFQQSKPFRYISRLGSGGTGETHLFEDPTTNIKFAIKKYVPAVGNDRNECYKRFVDEIKILFDLSHPNIVRIYNYYLYPDQVTGYLQMEYIDGDTIDNWEPSWSDWEDIFEEVINAFKYIQEKGILHRDIRPANILISSNDCVKIIDFGFGKKLQADEYGGHSVYLNWPATEMPLEIIRAEEYTSITEIYFVGKLFAHLDIDGSDHKFRYWHILEKMMQINPQDRYQSFAEVVTDITNGVLGEIEFTKEQKNIYQNFSDNMFSLIAHYQDKRPAPQRVESIILALKEVVRSCCVETIIPDNAKVLRCFISGAYSYYNCNQVKIISDNVKQFYKMIIELPANKQQVVIDNIYSRILSAPVEISDYELPF